MIESIVIIVALSTLITDIFAVILIRHDNTLSEADLSNVFPLGKSGYVRTGQQNKATLALMKAIEAEIDLRTSDIPTGAVVEDDEGLMMQYGER